MRIRAHALLLVTAVVMSAAPWTMADTSAPSEPPANPGSSPSPPFARLPLPVATPTSADGNDLDRMLQRLDDEEHAGRSELDQIGVDLDVTRRRITARARAYYKYVRAGFLPVGGGFDALVDHAATVERTRRALERDRVAESDLLQRGEAIRDKLARMRVMRAPLEVQREAMNRARTALQQADERKAAFSRAFESSVRPPDYMAIYGADTGPAQGDADAASGFRAQKGRLPMPITGRAEVRRVTRAGSNSPGIELSGVGGASARSVAPGRVVFADRHSDYGMTVLLDHGDGYYSLYGDLESIDVHVGDNLAQGSRIGAPGRDAPGRPSTLYFELRHGADTIDPAPWLGL